MQMRGVKHYPGRGKRVKTPLLPENVDKRSVNNLGTLQRVTTNMLQYLSGSHCAGKIGRKKIYTVRAGQGLGMLNGPSSLMWPQYGLDLQFCTSMPTHLHLHLFYSFFSFFYTSTSSLVYKPQCSVLALLLPQLVTRCGELPGGQLGPFSCENTYMNTHIDY